MMATSKESITMEKVARKELTFAIEGVGRGLLTSAVPAWVVEDIARKQAGLSPIKRAKRNIEEQFQDSLYYLSPEREGTKYGFPAGAFKKSIIRAVMSGEIDPALKGTVVRTWFNTLGGDEDDLVPIIGDPVSTTMAARNKGTLIATTRALFKQWKANVTFLYNPNSVNPELLAYMLNQAGEGVGIGAYRQETGGPFGRFQVVTE